MSDAQHSALPKPAERPAAASWLGKLLPKATLPRGTVLREKYKILRVLGNGQLGTTYLAEITRGRSKRKVVIKEWPQRQRDRVESTHRAIASSQAGMPNEIDRFALPGRRYSVSRNVEASGTLREAIDRDAPFSEARAIEIGLGLASTLLRLHARGIIHRDIKPSNILLTEAGKPILIDFGIARRVGDRPTEAVGSYCYAAPEQYRDAVDPRSDIYSLGAVIYEMVTGHGCRGRFSFTPVSDLNKSISPALTALIQDCLELEPQRRPTAAHLYRMLLALRANGRPATGAVAGHVGIP